MLLVTRAFRFWANRQVDHGRHWALSAAALLSTWPVLVGCSEETDPQRFTRVRMDFAAADFYGAPFPSDHRLQPDGTVDLTGYPNPYAIAIADKVVTLLDGQARGFGLSSGVFFALDGPIDHQTLPELHETVQSTSPVFLIGVDPAASDYGQRYPITVRFEADGGPFGSENMLSLVPLQGVPLLPNQRYAAVITQGVRDPTGQALAAPQALEQIAMSQQPSGLPSEAFSRYRTAFDSLAQFGLEPAEVAGLTVFTTAEPDADLFRLISAARNRPLSSPLEPFSQTDVFPDYCVYSTTLNMPVYQRGQAPYYEQGGDIEFTENGAVFDHDEKARIIVTIPRQTMPATGFPTAVMIRTGGGGDRPLVDRGPRAEPGGTAIEPGTGPAIEFARAGFAGVSVDGPHGGLRNITNDDEQFLIFNISNPAALRDNLRQSAMEIALLPDLLAPLTIDVSDCTGVDTGGLGARFDVSQLALMGHSMGATIAPLTMAVEPRFKAVILSGAGGSWIENMVYKEKPLPVAPLAEIMLGYPSLERDLHTHDSFLNLLQWAGESADPPIYGRRVTGSLATGPRHILMLQGIVDHYILPPIANATSLSLGLDLAEPALDEGHPELTQHRPLTDLLLYSAGATSSLPIALNRNIGPYPCTLVVAQHPEDGIEDGHEVVFQTALPKRQYRCFLESFLAGKPEVVAAGGQSCTE